MSKRLARGAGILLPISSLPSRYGIGTFGQEAYDFVDKLVKAGQKYWQVLPLGPTSYGDSPYQSFSAFAGNPYFIDLDVLISEGLLEEEELKTIKFNNNDRYVEYDIMYENRFEVLRTAFEKWKETDSAQNNDYIEFTTENKEWLDDYTLFMACKNYYNDVEWLQWDQGIKERRPEEIKKYTEMLQEDVDFYKFLQFKFFEQWLKLRSYANIKGISIIGDIPIYVAMDSCDIWVNPKLFQVDDDLNPIAVAGCPPDAFSDAGQKWGNPLYDWEAHENEGFTWWKNRIKGSAKLYDVIRIDHFIGIAKYYSIPLNEDARNGYYTLGPGIKLVNAINEVLAEVNVKIIAEDLGVQGPEVKELLEESGYPGMKMLMCGLYGQPTNEHLPHNYERNCVAYIGTHDNNTLVGYLDNLNAQGFKCALQYLDATKKDEIPNKLMRVAYMSIADTVILQMQDILKLDGSARMNLPGTIGPNWKWRMLRDEFDDQMISWLNEIVYVYRRF